MLRIGRAEVDLRKYRATTADGTVELKEKEAMILRLLAEHPGEPVDRETILDRVWGFGAYPTTRTVDQHVVKLRQKIADNRIHRKASELTGIKPGQNSNGTSSVGVGGR